MTPMHPYQGLPPSRFWKTAVAEPGAFNIQQVWTPKFGVSPDSRLLTAGSCFAQHISKALVKEGFAWIESEVAPQDLSDRARDEAGYGVFSFRTGNIYTAALLRQWLQWATGEASPSEEIFFESGRYFDPFRPTVPANGFADADTLFAARTAMLESILSALQRADLFIFTLGLTEAWRSREGFVYPMCPGTLHGSFDPERHSFHNYTFDEVVVDLQSAFDSVHRVNPNMKFLLTVSPVPLTATAADEHVLVATTYSKSVLRAAAGALTKRLEHVDYFPSYELISSAPFEGRFFDGNLRSVTGAGVNFVMSNFLAAIGHARRSDVEKHPDETVCEEIVLETWARRPKSTADSVPALVLVGDSHMGKIAGALNAAGVPYVGGAVMFGSNWHNQGFDIAENEYFMPHEAAARARWVEIYDTSFARIRPSMRNEVTVVTNIGMHSHMLYYGLLNHVSSGRGSAPTNITVDEIRRYLTLCRAPHVALVRRMVQAGYRVIFVSDPPSQVMSPDVFTVFDDMMADHMATERCQVFNARRWISEIGGFPAGFRSKDLNADTGQLDWIHGSDAYYAELTERLQQQFC